ncbi:MAG: hypothetical protein Q7R39_12810 [Dehalococcoidia bacterium]|nr:hypothetical protein [Dehalococcoidia bacterium]
MKADFGAVLRVVRRNPKLLLAAGLVMAGAAILGVGVTGVTSVGVRAQSSGEVEEGSAPYAVIQALTEEEAAAGVPVQEAQYFDSFEEALQSIGADPDEYQAGEVSQANVSQAADPPSDAEPSRHCVVRVEPVRPRQEASRMSAATCFDSFSDAVYAATGGAVRLAPTVAPAEVTEQTLNPLSSHQTVISIHYRDSNFSGVSFMAVANNTVGCTTGISYALPSMPSGWNDVVSSARTFAGCSFNRHYEHTNYGGAKIDCQCATMGTMNDKTSSLKWSRVQPSP